MLIVNVTDASGTLLATVKVIEKLHNVKEADQDVQLSNAIAGLLERSFECEEE